MKTRQGGGGYMRSAERYQHDDRSTPSDPAFKLPKREGRQALIGSYLPTEPLGLWYMFGRLWSNVTDLPGWLARTMREQEYELTDN